MARALMESEVMPLVLRHMKTLDFEARKGIAMVFNHILRHNVATFATQYMGHHTALLYQMMDG